MPLVPDLATLAAPPLSDVIEEAAVVQDSRMSKPVATEVCLKGASVTVTVSGDVDEAEGADSVADLAPGAPPLQALPSEGHSENATAPVTETATATHATRLPEPSILVSLFPSTSYWTNNVPVAASVPLTPLLDQSEVHAPPAEDGIAPVPVQVDSAASCARTLNVNVKGWVHISKKDGFRRNLLLGIGKRILSPIRSDRSRLASQVFEERAGAFLDAGFTEQGAIRVCVLGLKKKQTDRDPAMALADIESLIGSSGHHFDVIPLMNSSGLFDETIRVPEETVEEWQRVAGGSDGVWMNQLEFVAYKKSGSQAGTHAFGTCAVVQEQGYSVITDLDDTIKDSDVYRGPTAALNNALFTPSSSAIAGMSVLYNKFATECDISFHYVSASPFQLLEMINNFLVGDEFPVGSVTLRDVWHQSSRRGYKDEVIKGLFTKYPNRKFILIGDAGEKDAEIYASVLKANPDKISKILIRSVDNDEEKIKIVRKSLEGVPEDKWAVFSDPAALHHLTTEFKKL
ncbi:hypothetical protein BC830DRAFT_1163672 [Chytriomyces sp. MP71]|nr:hypothetical protein BC830DRAFT_1163672 [Chytriomyces sp. MP71]